MKTLILALCCTVALLTSYFFFNLSTLLTLLTSHLLCMCACVYMFLPMCSKIACVRLYFDLVYVCGRKTEMSCFVTQGGGGSK